MESVESVGDGREEIKRLEHAIESDLFASDFHIFANLRFGILCKETSLPLLMKNGIIVNPMTANLDAIVMDN